MNSSSCLFQGPAPTTDQRLDSLELALMNCGVLAPHECSKYRERLLVEGGCFSHAPQYGSWY